MGRPSREQAAEARRQEGRKERIPLGVRQQKLQVRGIPPHKTARWINDVPGRLQSALDAGWEFVMEGPEIGFQAGSGNENIGSRVSKIVGRDEQGAPMTAYLMVIDKDLYEQDQMDKERQIKSVDDAIRNGADVQGNAHLRREDLENRYLPRGGITYEP